MIPLLPFFAGIVVGAAALSALRSERTRQTLNETGARLRGAVAEKLAKAKPAARKKPVAVKPAAPKRAPRKPKTTKAEI